MEIHETANSIEKNPRILVADDYEVNQKVAQLILDVGVVNKVQVTCFLP